MVLNDEIRRLLDGRHYAVLATLNPDGGPQTSAMWVGRDGDDVLMSTLEGRRKHRNLLRDPRASVTVLDANPENYVEHDPDPDPPGAVRVVLRLTVDKATGYAA